MTMPDDLAAIEAAHFPPGMGGAFGDEGYCRACCQAWPCDARRLLDEHKSWYELEAWVRAEEREHIAAAVRGLPNKWDQPNVGIEALAAAFAMEETRAAVLAAIEGKPPSDFGEQLIADSGLGRRIAEDKP